MVVPSERFSISIMVASLLEVTGAVSEGFANRGTARALAAGFVATALGFKRSWRCDAVFFMGLRGAVLLLCVFIIRLLRASLATAYAVTVGSPGEAEALRGGLVSGAYWCLTPTATLCWRRKSSRIFGQLMPTISMPLLRTLCVKNGDADFV